MLRGIPIYEEQADIELSRSEYREVKPAALGLPDDIPDETDGTVAGTGVSEAESDQDAPIANPAAYLSALEGELAAAKTAADYNEVWEAAEQLIEAGRLTAEDARAAEDMAEKHGKRFKG